MGRNGGIRPADLVGAIANESGLTGRDIGPIRDHAPVLGRRRAGSIDRPGDRRDAGGGGAGEAGSRAAVHRGVPQGPGRRPTTRGPVEAQPAPTDRARSRIASADPYDCPMRTRGTGRIHGVAAIVLVAAALGAAGGGDDDDDAGAATTVAGGAVVTPVAADTTAAGAGDGVRHRRRRTEPDGHGAC